MLSIIVVSYNTKERTRACLEALQSALCTVQSEIVVIDNASPDGSADAIAKAFPEIRLIRAGANLGFGRACNAAAGKTAGQFLLFLNPDTRLFQDSITKLMEFSAAFPGACIWGGQLVDATGAPDPNACRRFPGLWDMVCLATGLSRAFPRSGLFNREVYGGWSREGPRQVDVVSGAMMLIKRDLWEELAGFDPIYFLYSEEVDLCYRARKLGVHAMTSPAVKLYHEGGAAEPNRGKRLIHLLQGKATFLNRHWSPGRRRFGKILLLLWPLGRWLVFSINTRLRPNGPATQKTAEWQKVWQARHQWIEGYPEPHCDP